MTDATRGQRFLDELHHGILIGDGAMGTVLFARGVAPDRGVERMNLLAPNLVRALHGDYVAAGSRVIETNTFGANRPNLARYGAEDHLRPIILAGTRLAREACRPDTYVAGSIGPLGLRDGAPIERDERLACFTEQVDALLDGGVDLLIFETFTALDELVDAVTIARRQADLPIVAQMAFESGGCTPDGYEAAEVLRRCREAGASVVGANCGHGVASVANAIRQMAGQGTPLSAYINAGFPEQIEGRLLYVADPTYLVRRAADLMDLGVRLIGGCCGTTPETIRALAECADAPRAVTIAVPRPATSAPREARLPGEAPTPSPESGPLPLTRGGILVELDPPTSLEVAPLLEAAHALREAGATAVTMADNPMASVRVDNLTVAGLVQREAGIPVIPHLTGRDRNRIALQSAIMGAHVQGVRALLCVTGDPVRMHHEQNTSGVFDLTSVGLVGLVSEFNAGRRLPNGARTGFAIGVALNPNVRTISGQITKLARKLQAGASFALTQPVFEDDRLDLLQDALAEAGLEVPIYLGILPLTSARNADFLHNEVPGMRIPEAVRERLARYSDVADQRAAGIEIAAGLAARFAPRVHGLYLIAPRNRADVVLPVLQAGVSARC